MFQQFIKAGGDKDQFVRRFMLKKVSESPNQLDEEGGYYTPEEMKKQLSYSQTDLVDKNIKYYWRRTRVKGLKRLRQTQSVEETAEAEGTGPMMVSGLDKNACTPVAMGLQTASDVENAKTEEDKLRIQQQELLSVQEKCSNLIDKLPSVPPEKKDRAEELRTKLDAMSKMAEKLYEKMAESLAKLHTKQLDTTSLEGSKLVLDLTTEGKKLPGPWSEKCCMWTGLERTCRIQDVQSATLIKYLAASELCPWDTTETQTAKFMADAIGSGVLGPAFASGVAAFLANLIWWSCYKQLEMFKPSVRDLPRLQELLLKGLGKDDRVKLCLPRPLLSAGKALLSIRERVAGILRLGPTVFKIGLTGDPMFRFYKVPSRTNASAGYRYDLDQYAEMQVLFAGATWDEASLMEAVLIAEFQGRPGNRNINPGGEGRQVFDPPYFTYIVFKSALVAPKRQRMYAQGGKRGSIMSETVMQ
ncbi:unnamed protein product [Symbiodinium sp. CCMP2456]|nr:unnamed protein product [Symbiodinium sp. CCMP2456]